jgi:hypothetical protein
MKRNLYLVTAVVRVRAVPVRHGDHRHERRDGRAEGHGISRDSKLEESIFRGSSKDVVGLYTRRK